MVIRKCVGALLAVLIVAAGCAPASSSKDATPTPYPTPVVPIKQTFTVQRGEVVETVEFTGRIAPVVEEELFFRTSGYVEAIHVQKGDPVKAGSILAELEATDLKNQLAQAEASLKAAQSKNDQQIAEAKANLRAAELRLAQLRVSDPSPQVVIAEVALERARTAHAEALDEYNKSLNRPWEPEKLREAYARRLHEAELNLRVAEAQHQQAVSARQSHYYSIQMQEDQVARARQQLEQLESGIDIESTRLTVERLKSQLDSTRLIAPFDGYVMSIGILKGRAVEARRPAAIVAALDRLEVSAKLTDQQMTDLVEGMPATVRLPRQAGQSLQGRIRRLPYSFSGGGSTNVLGDEDLSTRIALTMTSEINLQVGDLVEVVIVLDRKDNVLWVPPLAIRTFEGRQFVVVQDGPVQRRVDVQVGLEGKDRVEIKQGLTEGQVVVGP